MTLPKKAVLFLFSRSSLFQDEKMGQIPSRKSDDESAKFHQQLSRYDFPELKLIYEYLRKDLIYIVEFTDLEPLLERLASRHILDKEIYLPMKRDLGPFVFSEKLVQEVLDGGKEAVVGFWQGLYDLQFHCSSSPNFYSLRDEWEHFGESLTQQIILDHNGHPLTPELKELQERHRKHLLETTRPSQSTGQNSSFHISHHCLDMIGSHVRPFHRASEHNLIETAIKHKDYLPNSPGSVSTDKLFRWCRRLNRVPHAVMVTGLPGIGKTTLLEKLVCDWAKGKLYQRFSFVFFFRFRFLNSQETTSLESMILQEYPYLEDQLEDVLRDPKRLLFIFDGLDESLHEMNFKSGRDVENVGSVVVGLARQSLLKGCSLLVTSQPDRLAGKDISVFKRVLELVGFLPKGRQLYIERFFKNVILSDEAFGFLKENGVLYNFCYNPSYCWILCSVLSKCFEGQPTKDDPTTPPLPKTLTQLFATFIADVLSGHSLDKTRSRSLLTSIGWMAEHGVMNHLNKFGLQTLSKFDVDATSTLLPIFMKEYSSSPEASFSFLHPIVQDFLAAVTHYIDYSPEKLRSSLEETESYIDNRGELFVGFLCGLSDVSTRTILEPHLGELSSDAAKDVLTWLQQDVSELEKRRLLSSFWKFFELQNKDFVSERLPSSRSFDFTQVHPTPLDCSVLSFILRCCGEAEYLYLSECRLQSESVERLAATLHTVHDLRFSDNKFGDDGVKFISSALKHPECKIRTLWLSATGLTDKACSYLGPALQENKSLRTLLLSYNRLEGGHFGDLMTALSSPTCRLEELYLDSNGLTESSASLLVSGIRSNQSLKTLSLSFNYLTGPHFGDLMEALSSPTCAVENLMLQGLSLEDAHLPLLMPLSKSKRLTYLDLSHNSIRGAGTPSLHELILKSPSLKRFCLFSYHGLPSPVRRCLMELEAHKPGLHISI